MRRNSKYAILIAALGACTAFGGQKLAPELRTAAPGDAVPVIVRWRHAPQAADHAKVFQRGGGLLKSFSHINAAAYAVPGRSLPDLANDPDVEYVAPDRPVHGLLDYTTAAVNAAAAWSHGVNGTGVTVAVIDSGMNPNLDLGATQLLLSQDFTGEYKMHVNPADPNNAPDTFGHGQHVAGIIASTGASSACPTCTRTMTGVAPGVKLVNFRVLDENGNGTDSAVIAAIDQAIELKNQLNIRAINLSIGRPVYESYTQDPLCQAVEQAWKAGIVVVVAAGNEGRDNSFGNNGYGTITAPGNDPYVITVGAMKTMQTYSRTDDLIASYSSKGPSVADLVVKPDIVAPGNMVVSLLAAKNSTLAKSYPSNVPTMSYYASSLPSGQANKPSPAYFSLSGTSMATPVVTGAVADLLQAQPNLTPDQVKARLMLTAYKTFPASSTATDPVTGQSYLSYYDPFTVGAGYLDIAAALSSTAVAQGTALSPKAQYDAATDSVYLVFDPSSVWAPMGAQVPFNVGAVWPVTFLDAQSVAWGQRISASSVAWGQRLCATSVAWGQKRVFAASVPGTDGTVSESSTPTAQSSTVAIYGEQ
jgi:serine protease AprX